MRRLIIDAILSLGGIADNREIAAHLREQGHNVRASDVYIATRSMHKNGMLRDLGSTPPPETCGRPARTWE